MRAYWSAHQRFFKQLCISIKLPSVIREAEAALAADCCVIFGLQTTGGTALEEAMSRRAGDGIQQAAPFVSVCRHIVRTFIANNFPTTRLEAITQQVSVTVPADYIVGQALHVNFENRLHTIPYAGEHMCPGASLHLQLACGPPATGGGGGTSTREIRLPAQEDAQFRGFYCHRLR